MDIFDEIVAKIRAEIDNGATYESLAQKLNVPKSSLNCFANKTKDVGKMTLYTFLKLFPRAKITLEAPIHNNGIIATVNHGSVNHNYLNEVEKKILDDSDLSSDEKVKFLRVLKK